MDWKVLQKPEIKIIAHKRSFNEETAHNGIPAFYKEYKHSELKNKIPAKIGVCIIPEEPTDWIYAIGDYFHPGNICPDGFEIITEPAQDWAVFFGTNGNEIMNYIYTDWFLSSGYEILPGDTLEFYNDTDDVVEVWVPTRKIN